MGIWGSQLYDNDIAMDVRDTFETKIESGETAHEAIDALLSEKECVEYTEIDNVLFWAAFADTLCDYNIYNEHIIDTAKAIIDHFPDVDLLNSCGLSFVQSYKKELERLSVKLRNWEGHKTKNNKVDNLEWHIGDVYYYKICQPELENQCDYQYIIFYVVDLYEWSNGQIMPIVYVKLSNSIITSVADFDDLDFIQTASIRYEERFWPIDGRDPLADIQRKSKIKYNTDEYGFLPQYRVKLRLTKRFVKQNMVFVGNYAGIKAPANEFIPHHKLNIHIVKYQEFPDTFIRLYHLFNLRECMIYYSNRTLPGLPE